MNSKNDRLREARINAGYESATLAAEALGVPPPTYTSHENGTRGFKDNSAELYARRFKVSLEWLVYGRGPKNQSAAQGFNESGVQAIDMASYLERLSVPEASSVRTPFSVSIGLPDLGIMDNSLILVDISKRPKTGDIVLATRDDREHGYSQTVIRRMVGRFLVGSPRDEIIEIDSSITLRGRVVQAINDM